MTLLGSLVNLLAGMEDATRLAYVEVLADEQQATSIGFLSGAVAWFNGRGVDCRKVISENGPAYLSRSFAKACKALYLKHIRTGPYTPRANGKAERLFQTLCKECDYTMAFQNSKELDNCYLSIYNWRTNHSLLGRRYPQQRLNQLLS